ncbi:MAG: hypothetical protein Q8P82_03000 [bacterium]|nr:hypothetical protein [bacterium]
MVVLIGLIAFAMTGWFLGSLLRDGIDAVFGSSHSVRQNTTIERRADDRAATLLKAATPEYMDAAAADLQKRYQEAMGPEYRVEVRGSIEEE